MQIELTFVCISDTHSLHNGIKLPKGDVLIHCGDFTNLCKKQEAENFIEWLKIQPFKHKVVIAGNHDICFDTQNYKSYLKYQYHQGLGIDEDELKTQLEKNCIYLMNSSIKIEGYKIWGSPYSLEHWGKGFQLPYEKAEQQWQKIDSDADIVVTHGPPYGHGDIVHDKHVGDKELFERIKNIKPKYHLFGHIHQGYGITKQDNTTFINSSLVDEDYQIVNKPIVFKLPRK